MLEKGVPGKIVIWSLLMVAGLGAAGVNIAPDAVTRATEGYNIYEGDVAFLTDGVHPENSDEAGLFIWPNKGNLTFQFDEPRKIAGMRLYVGGDAGAYQVVAYLGAYFSEMGQTEAALAVAVADTVNFDFEENTWVDLPFPPETEADYIELSTESGTELYEIEILVPGEVPTAVGTRSWGEIKAARWK